MLRLNGPNCGGDLQFDPALQKFRCEYCSSEFTQEEAAAANQQATESKQQEEKDESKNDREAFEEADLYLCQAAERRL